MSALYVVVVESLAYDDRPVDDVIGPFGSAEDAAAYARGRSDIHQDEWSVHPVTPVD